MSNSTEGFKTVTSSPLNVGINTTALTSTSDTTLNDVTDLCVDVAANSDYVFNGQLLVSGNAPGNLKIKLNAPSGASVRWALPADTDNELSVTSEPNFTLDGTDKLINFNGVVEVGSTSGTLQVQAAQDVSNATATTVKANSILTAQRLPKND